MRMLTLLFLILLNLYPVFLTGPDETSPYNLTSFGESSLEHFIESPPGHLTEPLPDHLMESSPGHLTKFSLGHFGVLSPDFLHLQVSARFLLMLDTSKGMAFNGKLDHMKAFATNLLINVKPGTYVAIINYGKEATMMSSWVSVATEMNQLINKISTLTADGGDACTVCGFKMAELLMLDIQSDNKCSFISITGQQDGSVGGSIADQSVWEPFKRRSIQIQTILYGSEGFALQVLTTETKGKYYTMMDFGGYHSALRDVSKTFIPTVVGDSYEWMLMDVIVSGTESFHCRCAKAAMIITDQNNKDIRVIIRLENWRPDQDFNPHDYIDTVLVEDKSGNSVDGWTFSFENGLSNPMSEPGEFMVHVYFKKVDIHMITQIKGTYHRTSPNKEPYIVECKYPAELMNGEFLISSQVKQGYLNRVSGATVWARITKSLNEDPEGLERACFVMLREGEDGLRPLLGAFDGVYSYILDPRNCFNNVANAKMMTVICNMFYSPDVKVTENDFWT